MDCRGPSLRPKNNNLQFSKPFFSFSNLTFKPKDHIVFHHLNIVSMAMKFENLKLWSSFFGIEASLFPHADARMPDLKGSYMTMTMMMTMIIVATCRCADANGEGQQLYAAPRCPPGLALGCPSTPSCLPAPYISTLWQGKCLPMQTKKVTSGEQMFQLVFTDYNHDILQLHLPYINIYCP